MITVLGARGFVGSHVVGELTRQNLEFVAAARGDDWIWRRHLGNVLYCVGLTADFRTHPHETMEAHVSLVSRLLRDASFDSLLYLSSTRVYSKSTCTHETASVSVSTSDAGDLYNVSKLAGESLCLCDSRESVRVARLSNVFGPGASPVDFLPSLIRAAVVGEPVVIRTHADSEKDYVGVHDVAAVLVDIVTKGRDRIYNVASGVNTTNAEIARALEASAGIRVEFAPDARVVRFPAIDVGRVRGEFGFTSRSVLGAIPALLAAERGR